MCKWMARASRALLLFVATSQAIVAAPLFVNELHYDNAGTDQGEFVELAGHAGFDLSGWSLWLYNGGNGLAYRTYTLSGILADDTGTGFGLTRLDLPTNGLQNGAADGLALVDSGGLVWEFLSYEGVLTALGGPAVGLLSVDIGVSESASTPLGASLQRIGGGHGPADFVWQASVAGSPGRQNIGQWLHVGASPLATPMPISLIVLGVVTLVWRRHRCGSQHRSAEPDPPRSGTTP